MGEINVADALIFATIFFSILLSYFRGFVLEAYTLVTIVTAILCSIYYGPDLGNVLAIFQQDTYNYLIGRFIIFFGMMLCFYIIRKVLCKVLSYSKPSPSNKFMGALFGLVRGGIFVIIAVMATMNNKIANEEWYLQSTFIPKLEPYAQKLFDAIPDDFKNNLVEKVNEMMKSYN